MLEPQTKPDFVGDNRWKSMHERYVSEAKAAEVEVLFIGDSIVQQLQFTRLWIDKIGSLHCLNFGIGGDRVEHVLWRVLNGELDFAYPPKIVVLSVGTNNVGCTAQQVFDGICELVKAIIQRLGPVHVILPTLLPRGQYPNTNRERNSAVNWLLEVRFTESVNVHVVPIHHGVVQKDDTISHHVLYDYLHLTNEAACNVFLPVFDKLQSVLCSEYAKGRLKIWNFPKWQANKLKQQNEITINWNIGRKLICF